MCAGARRARLSGFSSFGDEPRPLALVQAPHSGVTARKQEQ
jgi:hypothetical protein